LSYKTSFKNASFLFLLLLGIGCSSGAFAKDKPQRLSIAAIDWCPQICPEDKNLKGYIVDIVEAVYEDSKVALDIQYFPWSRAIHNVRTGKSHALLSPAKKEAPDLIYPATPLGIQKMCFFTLMQSGWAYTGPNSLGDMQIGVAEDTSLEELHSFMRTHPNQFQFQPYHERFVVQNAKKLMKGRIDTFLFTLNTTNHIFKQEGLNKKIKSAGCVNDAPVYIAFSPALKDDPFMLNAMKLFETRFNEMLQQKSVNSIFEYNDVHLSAKQLLRHQDK